MNYFLRNHWFQCECQLKYYKMSWSLWYHWAQSFCSRGNLGLNWIRCFPSSSLKTQSWALRDSFLIFLVSHTFGWEVETLHLIYCMMNFESKPTHHKINKKNGNHIFHQCSPGTNLYPECICYLWTHFLTYIIWRIGNCFNLVSEGQGFCQSPD